jgi:hypothetical protein
MAAMSNAVYVALGGYAAPSRERIVGIVIKGPFDIPRCQAPSHAISDSRIARTSAS